IERRASREGLHNVRTILGTAVDPRLGNLSLDAVLIVDAYHEIENPKTLLANTAKSLKPTRGIGVVDFKREGGRPGPEMDERVDPEKVIQDTRAVGLELRKREHFLRYQYLLIFGLPADPK